MSQTTFAGTDAKGAVVEVRVRALDFNDAPTGYALDATRTLCGGHVERGSVRLLAGHNTADVLAMCAAAQGDAGLLPILADALEEDGDPTADGQGLAWLTNVLRTPGLAGQGIGEWTARTNRLLRKLKAAPVAAASEEVP